MKSTGADKTHTAEVIRQLENVPTGLREMTPEGLPYSIWQWRS